MVQTLAETPPKDNPKLSNLFRLHFLLKHSVKVKLVKEAVTRKKCYLIWGKPYLVLLCEQVKNSSNIHNLSNMIGLYLQVINRVTYSL